MGSSLNIQDLFVLSITVGQILKGLTVSLLCGFLISRFYLWINGRPNHPASFVNSLVILTMITSVVILVIGNNLARAFGLVGAMSIIRFRTAVKDVQDIAFIFFSLTIGMAAGVGLWKIAIVGTAFIGLVMLALSRFKSPVRMKREYLLQLLVDPSGGDDAPYMGLLSQYCRRHSLVNVGSAEPEGHLEVSYYVLLKDEGQSEQFAAELGRLEGVRSANLYFDEEYS
jgi:uncharacterized membrane protein YhiD involved in acid resistance